MENIALRDMNYANAESITAIESRVHRNPWSKNSILLHLDNPIAVSLGLFSDSTLIGYLLGQHFDNEFHVLNLAIDKSSQARGFGNYLLSQAIYELWQRGVKTCFLEVRPSNTRALNLYKKIGFKTIAVRKRYYQDNLEDALVLTLELGNYREYQFIPDYRDKFTNKFDLFWLKR